MDIPALEGTALQELLIRISAMPGATFTEQATAYADLLKSQQTEVTSKERNDLDKLEPFVRAIVRLERNSLLAKRSASAAQVSYAA